MPNISDVHNVVNVEPCIAGRPHNEIGKEEGSQVSDVNVPVHCRATRIDVQSSRVVSGP